jgi:hypothetical protein
MSEDLRYYFFDGEHEERPAIPAEEGWNNMRQLLDKHLPQKNKKPARRYFFFGLTGLLCAAFTISSLTLQTDLAKNKIGKEEKILLASAHVIKPNDPVGKTNNQYNKIFGGNTEKFIPGNITANKKNLTLQQTIHPAAEIQKNGINSFINDLLPGNTTKAKNITDSLTSNTTFINPVTDTLPNEPAPGKKKTATNKLLKKNWQLSTGVAMNISVNANHQSLQPYPFAQVKYSLSKTFYIAAGLNLFSPVASNANGLQKTMYLGDTLNNINLYDQRLHYKKLQYIDVPLTAGIKINKHISAEAGIQVSKLISTKTATTLDPYTLNAFDIRPLGSLPVIHNHYELRKTDIRYIAGVCYEWEKISVNLQYQLGSAALLKGNAVSPDKNKVLSLKIAYRFK